MNLSSVRMAGHGQSEISGRCSLQNTLSDFSTLKRKAIRVIAYRGSGRIETIREQEGARGYAAGFEGLIGFINGLSKQ